MKKIISIVFVLGLFVLYKFSSKKEDNLELISRKRTVTKVSQPLPSHKQREPAGKKSVKVRKVIKGEKDVATTSHPLLDEYPRTDLNFQSLFVVSNIFADFYARPYLQITEVAGLKVYEGSEKKNVIFDSARGLYCAWTGIVTLSADSEVLAKVTSQLPLKYLESAGGIKLLQSSDEFDLVKHLPELMSIEGVGDVSLDLNYAKLEAK